MEVTSPRGKKIVTEPQSEPTASQVPFHSPGCKSNLPLPTCSCGRGRGEENALSFKDAWVDTVPLTSCYIHVCSQTRGQRIQVPGSDPLDGSVIFASAHHQFQGQSAGTIQWQLLAW